jgi:uncharacterized protein YbaP (TraB family)
MIPSILRPARRLAVGLVALVSVAALAVPAVAEPMLWAIKDKDSTIYLFGTIHVLKPETQWRSAAITKAFAESGELVMEIQQPENPADLQPLVMKYGVDMAKPLSSKLDAETNTRLQAVAQGMGIPAQGVEPMRPWLAAVTLSMAPLIKAGYDPKSGVETLLSAEAKAAGKTVGALETAEQQLGFFAGLEPAQEVAMLKATLDDIDAGPQRIDAMVAGWAKGDTKALAGLVIEEMKADYPDLYQVLIVGRNQDWARQLKAKLAGSGVSFVAVGAGHLTGPDSVQAELAKLGVQTDVVR